MLPSQFDMGSGEQTPVSQQHQHFKYEPSKDSITTPTLQLHHMKWLYSTAPHQAGGSKLLACYLSSTKDALRHKQAGRNKLKADPERAALCHPAEKQMT